MTMRQHRVPSAADLSVPSPLVGEASASLMRRDEFGQEKQLQWGLT